MKNKTMFFKIDSLLRIGLILLLMTSFSATASIGSHHYNEFTSTITVASATVADAKVEKKKEVKHTATNYDKIDSEFEGIGPGNNTVPFIIALVVFLFATFMGRRKKCKSKIAMVVLALLAIAYLSKITYVEARALGRQQGYAPVQPIWFSHQVHATQNGIDCEYCHVDARTSRHAGVPSLNVCMNCHSQVKEGTITGKTEIAKIYKHLGLNPETLQKEKEETPVEWVKVHNLPDHVYFNHAQHVQAGKVECQECHGPVENMNRVVEFEEFAMGDFCLDCHRKRGIDTSNPYYKHYKFKEMKEKQGIDKITVDKIGGADCSACHY
jgi:hypothetical protein